MIVAIKPKQHWQQATWDDYLVTMLQRGNQDSQDLLI